MNANSLFLMSSKQATPPELSPQVGASRVCHDRIGISMPTPAMHFPSRQGEGGKGGDTPSPPLLAAWLQAKRPCGAAGRMRSFGSQKQFIGVRVVYAELLWELLMYRKALIALTFPLFALPVPVSAMPESGIHRVSSNQGNARRCSADELPAADRQRMQVEYQRRVRSDGKARADAWVAEQARRFRQQLVAEGVCPPLAGKGRETATAKRSSEKRVVRGKDGRPCKRTRLENRNIANIGGGGMSMVLVPVCAD